MIGNLYNEYEYNYTGDLYEENCIFSNIRHFLCDFKLHIL